MALTIITFEPVTPYTKIPDARIDTCDNVADEVFIRLSRKHQFYTKYVCYKKLRVLPPDKLSKTQKR